MPSQKHQPKRQKKSDIPSQITREWLYDEIMRQVEPDLVSDQLPLLEKKYAGETKEQLDARIDRYTRAFMTFDAVVQDVSDMMLNDAREEKQKAQQQVSKAEQNERSSELKQVEDLLEHSGDSATAS